MAADSRPCARCRFKNMAKMEPSTGIEPVASSLPRKCSTTELRRPASLTTLRRRAPGPLPKGSPLRSRKAARHETPYSYPHARRGAGVSHSPPPLLLRRSSQTPRPTTERASPSAVRWARSRPRARQWDRSRAFSSAMPSAWSSDKTNAVEPTAARRPSRARSTSRSKAHARPSPTRS